MHLHHTVARILVDERQRQLRSEAPVRQRLSWLPRWRQVRDHDHEGMT
ncbi:MAG: hypothetical protein ACRD2C_17875 [Acidimicrobiales bacterium]